MYRDHAFGNKEKTYIPQKHLVKLAKIAKMKIIVACDAAKRVVWKSKSHENPSLPYLRTPYPISLT